MPRCRELYQRYLQWAPQNCSAWSSFAELETSLGELERTRAIFNLAINQTELDMPETLWKAYIDFEIETCESDPDVGPERVRDLYRQLLDRTSHPKVWISFAQFEAAGTGGAEGAAAVYSEADDHFREMGQKDERVLVLDAWKEMEDATADPDRVALVVGRMPKRLKKKRPVVGDDGEELGWEEYMDYIFPEEEAKAPSLKILEMAHKWKKQKTGDEGEAAPAEEEEEDDDW